MNASQDKLQTLRRILGSPSYEAPGVLIYCGDSLEMMRRIPADLVDLSVTSPPYNIGKEYETVRPLDQYLDWCETWIKELHRITDVDGSFWLNLGYVEMPKKARAVPLTYLLWDRTPFSLIQEVVWNYGAGVACRNMFSPRNEKFLWYVKNPGAYCFNLDAVRDPDVKYPLQRKNGKLKCNPAGKNPTDVWQFPKVTSGADRSSDERTPHPAQFPVAVIDRIIKSSSDVDDLVLDPFMGSGTSAEVALSNGRQVLGFEINPSYVEITARRLDSYFERLRFAKAQGKLALEV